MITIPYSEYTWLLQHQEELKKELKKKDEQIIQLGKDNGNSFIYVEKTDSWLKNRNYCYKIVQKILDPDEHDEQTAKLHKENKIKYIQRLRGEVDEIFRYEVEKEARLMSEEARDRLRKATDKFHREAGKAFHEHNKEKNQMRRDFNDKMDAYKNRVRRSFWRQIFNSK